MTIRVVAATLALIAVVAAATLVARRFVPAGLDAPRPAGLLATERSYDGRRQADLRWTREQAEDAGREFCGSIGIDRLSRRFGVAPTPAAIATSYAASYELSARDAAYSGCVKALRVVANR